MTSNQPKLFNPNRVRKLLDGSKSSAAIGLAVLIRTGRLKSLPEVDPASIYVAITPEI
jgi:hypothetical protein